MGGKGPHSLLCVVAVVVHTVQQLLVRWGHLQQTATTTTTHTCAAPAATGAAGSDIALQRENAQAWHCGAE